MTKLWKDIEAQQKNTVKPDKNLFTGTYNDKQFGDAIISLNNGKMWFGPKRSFLLNGEMFPYKGNTFLVVKWIERSMNADAFDMFNSDNYGKASGMKMKAISPLTDFSFDFQDLDFARVKEK